MKNFNYLFILVTWKVDFVSVVNFATLTLQAFDINMFLLARRKAFLQLPSLSALFLMQKYSQETKWWAILCIISRNR